MSVVDLNTGKPIDKAPEESSLVRSLKLLIKRIEDGELVIEGFYVIADCGENTHSFDSGLTATEAVMILEREKFHILCALAGVKV